MKSVAIVGGGVSGLVAAWHLATTAPSWSITVFEADERVGGKLRQEEIAGHRVDVGAESALWRRPEVVDLLAELGVERTDGLDAVHDRLLRDEPDIAHSLLRWLADHECPLVNPKFSSWSNRA